RLPKTLGHLSCDEYVAERSAARRIMKFVRVCAIAAVALCCARSLAAQDITITFHGTLSEVDSSPFADIYAGMPFSGAYTYNLDTTDTSPNPQIGEYYHTTGAYGVEVTIGSHTFRTNPLNPNFLIDISNDTNEDSYMFISYNNSLTNGYPIS